MVLRSTESKSLFFTEERIEFLAEEIRRRCRLLRRANADPELRKAIRAHLRNDPVAFFNDWLWTYDPRAIEPLPRSLPMALWPKQVELVEWLHERYTDRKHGVIKKGRDVGVTWLTIGYGVWLWLFQGDVSLTYASRKFQLVDRLKDPNTIFERARRILDMLPVWLLPEGYVRSKHALVGRIVNPVSGAVMTAEGGDEVGRGGRSTIFFGDEFAYMPGARTAKASIMDNSDCVIEYSTSNGVGTQFYEDEKSGNYDVCYLNYRDCPYLDHEAFKLRKVAEYGEERFAREHDMDDAAGTANAAIPGAWVQTAVNLDLPAYGPQRAALDVATTGANENAFSWRKGPVVQPLEMWSGIDTTATADLAVTHCTQFAIDDLVFDIGGVGAGVQGELRRRNDKKRLRFKWKGINSGSAPSDICYDDDPETPANARFLNRRAEMWWCARRRFQKTFEHVSGLREHPLDELVSIPNDARLIAELSTPLWFLTESGKIKIESKSAMAKRGVKSPDRGDSVVLLLSADAAGTPWHDGFY